MESFLGSIWLGVMLGLAGYLAGMFFPLKKRRGL